MNNRNKARGKTKVPTIMQTAFERSQIKNIKLTDLFMLFFLYINIQYFQLLQNPYKSRGLRYKTVFISLED